MALRILILGQVADDVRRDLALIDDDVEIVDAGPAPVEPGHLSYYRPHLLVLGDSAPFDAKALSAGEGSAAQDPVPVLSTLADVSADLRLPPEGPGRDDVLRLARRMGRMRQALAEHLELPFADRGAVLLGTPARFRSRLDYEFSRAFRYRHPVSLVTVAVDRLDSLAGVYGEAAIEEYLALLTEAFRRCLRDVDLLYRSTDREVTAILPETSASGASLAADRFLAATIRMVFKPTVPQGRPALPIKATSSIGVVDGPREGVRSANDLLSRLHDSVAGAQRAGGGQVFVHGKLPTAL